MILTEIHTSDLTAACLRTVQLRHEGKALAEAPTALYKGLLFGECARLVHTGNRWNTDTIGTLMLEAVANVEATLIDEGRRMTKAVRANLTDIDVDVARWVKLYVERFGGFFAGCKLLGCEVPIRMTIDVDGEPVEFASHLDLVYRDHSGSLCVDDWKTGEDSPVLAYVARNMQFGMYHLACRYGSVQIGGDWIELEETPVLTWVHVRNLMPYTRATTTKDDDGQSKTFDKGAQRPVRAIRKQIVVSNEQAVIDEFSTRVRMMRGGMFPTNPDRIGCGLCECRTACPSWTQEVDNEAE